MGRLFSIFRLGIGCFFLGGPIKSKFVNDPSVVGGWSKGNASRNEKRVQTIVEE